MLQEIYRKLVPIGIRYNIANIRQKRWKKASLSQLKDRWEKGLYDQEYKEELKYLIDHDTIKVFPYNWTEEYENYEIKVYRDNKSKMFYVNHNGKNLFFPKGYSKRFIKKYYLSLIMEQDIRSPHRYFIDKLDDIENKCFIDVGGAEGIISLDVIDQVKKVIIFECNDDWKKALQKTFEPWSNKVQIISKFVGECSSNQTISLDDFFQEQEEDIVLKLDVEGNEAKCLKGAESILKSNVRTVFVCTYHNDSDGHVLSALLEEYSFRCSFSNGYMFYGAENGLGSFRKGLIRAVKS